MTSVTDYEMALALGNVGGIGILPVKMPDKKVVEIVERIKQQDLSFVEDPLTVRENTTIDEVVSRIEQHGHSTIPIVNKFRKFLGMFVQENYWESQVSSSDPVTAIMIPYDSGKNNIDVCSNPEITVDQAKDELKKIKGKYMVVLDNKQRLIKMALKKDIEYIKVGVGISTHPGWEKRVEKNIEAGSD